MNLKLLVIAGLLAIACMMIAPVMADETTPVSIQGNPASYVAISLNQTSLYLPLDPQASPASNTSLGITATVNTGYQITVADTTSGTYNTGHLVNATTSGTLSPVHAALTSPLQFTGNSNSTYGATGSSIQDLTASRTVYTGSANTNPVLLTNTITQPVAYTDLELPTGYNYWIQLTYTIAATGG